MRLLLDTHVLIWSQECPEKLGLRSKKLLEDSTNERLFHSISTLEIARLNSLGQIQFQTDPATWIDSALSLLQATRIELSHEEALEAYRLPGDFHKDPCDRILVASARLHGVSLLTADDRILNYEHVRTISVTR